MISDRKRCARILSLCPDGSPPPDLPGAVLETIDSVDAAVEAIADGPVALVMIGGNTALQTTRQLQRRLTEVCIAAPPIMTDGAAAGDADRRAERATGFAEASADRLWETDAEDRIVAVYDGRGTPVTDDPVLRLGSDLGSVLSANGSDVPTDPNALTEAFRDIIAHQTDPRGEAVIYRLSGKPVVDSTGRAVGRRGAAADVTNAMRGQRAALRSRIRLYEAVETMPAAFMLFDSNDKLVLWNTLAHGVYPNARDRMFAGVTFEELIRAAAENGDIGEAMEESSRERWVADRLARHRTPGALTERRAPDGRWLRDTEHRTSFGGTVCVISDITELKQRQDQLRAAVESAEQANEAKSKFLAAASHDLRQPLHAFGLLIAGLSHRANTPEIERIASRMEQALDSLQDMLNALLDISRLDAGVLRAEIGEVDLLRMFERIDADFQPVAHEKNLKLVIRPCDARVRSDPMLLDRILRNLVSNAIRYTGEGGVLLSGRRRIGSDGFPVLRLECRDSGIGIPPKKQTAIFEEFRRLDEPVRDSRKGLGLGLSIVDRFAKLLGTSIELRSDVGRGSVFALAVPLADTPGAPVGDTTAAPNSGTPSQELCCPQCCGTITPHVPESPILLIEDQNAFPR